MNLQRGYNETISFEPFVGKRTGLPDLLDGLRVELEPFLTALVDGVPEKVELEFIVMVVVVTVRLVPFVVELLISTVELLMLAMVVVPLEIVEDVFDPLELSTD